MSKKPKTAQTRETKRCTAKGDFGHTNIWGTPFLMFGVSCSLKEGHEGKHCAKIPLRLVPSFEPTGRLVNRESVEIQGEAWVQWELKEHPPLPTAPEEQA